MFPVLFQADARPRSGLHGPRGDAQEGCLRPAAGGRLRTRRASPPAQLPLRFLSHNSRSRSTPPPPPSLPAGCIFHDLAHSASRFPHPFASQFVPCAPRKLTPSFAFFTQVNTDVGPDPPPPGGAGGATTSECALLSPQHAPVCSSVLPTLTARPSQARVHRLAPQAPEDPHPARESQLRAVHRRTRATAAGDPPARLPRRGLVHSPQRGRGEGRARGAVSGCGVLAASRRFACERAAVAGQASLLARLADRVARLSSGARTQMWI